LFGSALHDLVVAKEMLNVTLGNASSAGLAEAADANLAVHVSWALARTPGMRISDEPEILLADSGLPCDTFNLACRARLTADQAPQRIREAIAFFRKVGRPFTWWVGPADQPSDLGDLLLDAGLTPAETEVAMVADLAALRTYDLAPGGLDIRRARTAAELQDFARVVAANWTPPDPEVLRFYKLAAPVMLTPDSPQWLYVGYLAGEPVATAELVVGGGVAGLYNICTLEAYRRRGIGTALTLQPLLDARASGVHTAVLQAAAAGVGVYARIGFERFGGITEYKPPDR
jgi:ribosomal protein S18 acetylase RimI-like enzyme